LKAANFRHSIVNIEAKKNPELPEIE